MTATAEPISSRRAFHWSVLLLILTLAALLRFNRIADASFWLDEYLTVELSNARGLVHLELPRDQIIEPVPDMIRLEHAGPWSGFWTKSSTDVHPPLFYIVLRIWRTLFTDSDTALRALSVVLSLVAIVALFLAIEVQAGAVPALWASLLMAVAAPQIEYAQEVRSYMLLEACLLGAVAALLRIERSGKTPLRLLALGSLTLAAAMTHYLAFPLLGVIGLYILIRLRGSDRKAAMIAMIVSGVLFCVVWSPFAIAQSDGFLSRTSFVKPSKWTPTSWFLTLLSMPMRYFINAPVDSQLVYAPLAVLYVVPLVLLRKRPDLMFWWLWLAVGVGSIAISDLFRHGQMLDYPRYSLAVSPAAYALVAMLLIHLKGWYRHVLPLLFAVGSLVAIEGAYFGAQAKPNWREFARIIDQALSENDILVLFDPDADRWAIRCDVVGMQYYLKNKPAGVVLLNGPPTEPIQQRLRSSDTVWVYSSWPTQGQSILFPGGTVLRSDGRSSIGTLVRVPPSGSPSPASGPGPSAPP